MRKPTAQFVFGWLLLIVHALDAEIIFRISGAIAGAIGAVLSLVMPGTVAFAIVWPGIGVIWLFFAFFAVRAGLVSALIASLSACTGLLWVLGRVSPQTIARHKGGIEPAMLLSVAGCLALPVFALAVGLALLAAPGEWVVGVLAAILTAAMLWRLPRSSNACYWA